MKNLLLLCICPLLAASLSAQAPAPDQPAEVQALIKAVQTQEIQIAENQAKIDEKLAAVAEAVRVAKIYASRGGR